MGGFSQAFLCATTAMDTSQATYQVVISLEYGNFHSSFTQVWYLIGEKGNNASRLIQFYKDARFIKLA